MIKTFLRINFTVLILLLFHHNVNAGDRKCRPKKWSNRNKIVSIGSPKIISESWKDHSNPDIIITRYFATQYDSITIFSGTKKISVFNAKSYRIISPEYVEYYPNGVIAMKEFYDTANQSVNYNYDYSDPKHFEFYIGRNCISKETYFEDGSRKSFKLYGNKWSDSLYLEWTMNGVIKMKQTSGLLIQYSEEGIIKNKSFYRGNNVMGVFPLTSGISKNETYNNSGTLIKVIEYNTITQLRIYSEEGILRSVRFFEDTEMIIPTGTWLEYDEKGTLIKTEFKKSPAKEVNYGPEVVGDHIVMTYVEQRPEYVGGESNFILSVRKKIEDEICKSRKDLRGTYILNYIVLQNGSSVMKGFEGENVTYMGKALIELFNTMKWHPGKRNGVTVGTEYSLTIKIEKQKKSRKVEKAQK